MPDWFQPDPERSHFDNSPRDETVPVAGIFDAPAHIAIVNQHWVAFILGAIDRLGYGDVWGGTDLDRENAYHQILELEAMLMSPANLLIPFETFRLKVDLPSSTINGIGTPPFVVTPAGEVWRIDHASAWVQGNFSLVGVRTGLGNADYMFLQPNPVANTTYNYVGGGVFVEGNRTINLVYGSSSAGQSVYGHISGVRFKV